MVTSIFRILEKYVDPILPNGLDLIKFKLNFLLSGRIAFWI